MKARVTPPYVTDVILSLSKDLVSTEWILRQAQDDTEPGTTFMKNPG
jgi:hypothetical protein